MKNSSAKIRQKPRIHHVWMRLRGSLRLIAGDGCVEFHPASLPPEPEQVTVHRFLETIGGRAYHIEVTPVSNRWRAQLCRTPGLPTAMMPFYGTTPDEAARLLTKWLTLAHRPQHAPPALAHEGGKI